MQQEELMRLIQKKDQFQGQINKLTEEINQIDKIKNYQKGVTDHEGFPRKDLDYGDLAHYRLLKKRKNTLNNDHSQIMRQIEKKLYHYHQVLPKVQGSEEINISQTLQFKKQENPEIHEKPTISTIKQQKQKQQEWNQQLQKGHFKADYLPPFALIKEVTVNSPAYKGGIQADDLLSEFSVVNIYTPDNIKHIPFHIRENQQLSIVILRPITSQTQSQKVYTLKNNKKYSKIQLKLTPQRWQGRGLLGCRIDPI